MLQVASARHCWLAAGLQALRIIATGPVFATGSPACGRPARVRLAVVRFGRDVHVGTARALPLLVRVIVYDIVKQQ